MSDKIRIRLVPKTKGGESITMDLREIRPFYAKRLAPDVNRASEALKQSFSIGIESKLTRHNSLDAFIPRQKIKELFKADLVEQIPSKTKAIAYKSAKKFITTEKELKVPENMKDTIAFAYIPTPPEFYGISFIPPNVSLYQLRLLDVLRSLNGSLCHRNGWTGRNIRVAMADTGFAKHPYFDSQGYNIQRTATPEISDPSIDDVGHGTGESANVLILAPDCQFIGVKHDDYSALALETSLEQNPQILTNSWGWNIDKMSKSQLQNLNPNLFNELRDVENIINDALDDGIIVLFAAGNGHLAFPASLPEVISVGGVYVDKDGSLEASSYASSFRSQLYPGRQVPDVCGIVGEFSYTEPMKGHIMLPVPNGSELEGENMPSTKKNKGWGIFSGTSAATPQIAGVVALMLCSNLNLTSVQVKSILGETAKDVAKGKTALDDEATIGPDLATGFGFVDAYEACLAANRMT